MRVRVRDHGQLLVPAYRPELGEGVAMEHADASGVSLRIEIVIEDGLADLAPFAAFDAKEEDAGLVTAAPSPLKLGDDLVPDAI